MSQNVCRLCLFKSEPIDEIPIGESRHLQQIINEIFSENISLTKLELDGICCVCREKLKSFHEYYNFVLENQKIYHERQEKVGDFDSINPEFISIIKQEEDLEENKPLLVEEKSEDLEQLERIMRKRKIPRPKYRRKSVKSVQATQKQQSDFIGLIFDFKCLICRYNPVFNTYHAVVKHSKSVHGTAKVWNCCEKEMSCHLDMIAHVMEHGAKDKQEWKCGICELTFLNPIQLWRHKYSHEEDKMILQSPHEWVKLSVTCDICGEKFRAMFQIIKHMKEVHIKKYSCFICNMGFNDRKEAAHHRKTMHTESSSLPFKDVHIKKYSCFICNMTFHDRKEAAHHRRTQHTDISKLPCPVCGIMITNKGTLMTAHINRLHTERTFICATCGKVYTNEGRYRSHILTHKPPSHPCTYCDKKFMTSCRLKDHLAIHSGIPRYHCEICSAPFKSAGNYSAHKRKIHPIEYQQLKLQNEAKKYKL